MNHTLPTRIDTFTGQWAFLSLSHPWPVTLSDGHSYKTGEHALWALKAGDTPERLWIADAPTPADARKRGRRIDPCPAWEKDDGFQAITSIVGSIYARGNNPTPTERIKQLLSTGLAELVNTNDHHDNRWGTCTCGQGACATPGDNLLGLALTGVRMLFATGSRVSWYIAQCRTCHGGLGVPYRHRYQAQDYATQHMVATGHQVEISEEITL